MSHRWLASAALLVSLLSPLLARSAVDAEESPAEPPAMWVSLSAGAFFPSGEDAAGTVGFAVLDDPAGPPFWSAFAQLGGVEQLGRPLSRPFGLPDARVYQVFQNAMLRWTPGGSVELADALDLVWAAGHDSLLGERGVPPVREPDADAFTRLGWLTDDAIRDAYFSVQHPGVADGLTAALARYGLPASIPEEREGALVQRFDKTVLSRDLITGLVSQLPVGTLLLDGRLLPASVLAPDHMVGGQLVSRAMRSVLSWPNVRGWGVPEPAASAAPPAPVPTVTSIPAPVASATATPQSAAPTTTPRSGDRAAATPSPKAAPPQPGALLTVKAVVNQGRTEHVVIANEGTAAQELTGWSLRSGTGGQQIAFPTGFTLSAGATVRVHSGAGASAQNNPPTDLFGTGTNIWNNSGDMAILVDPAGRIAHQLSYGG